MEQIGPYRVLGEVARGGMGVVFRAQGPDGRDVALKLLLAQRAENANARRRFVLEARALSRLRHPNVVAVEAVGEARGAPWLALEFVEGQTLGERLQTGPLPVWETIRLGRQLAGALGYVHGCGVLHRDLKPDNVMLRGDQALLTDFGLARDADDDALSRITASGVFLGTPGYWAPEQARGARHEFGPHTDVYGLGAVLYACLTGQPPVAGDSPLVCLEAGGFKRIPPPRRLRPEVPLWLDALCMECLAEDPAQRPPSADAVARALVQAVGAQRGERAGGLLVALGVSAALAVAAVLGAWALARSGPPPEAPQLEGRKRAVSAPQVGLSDLLERIAEHHAQGRFEEEIAELDRALELSPADAALYGKRGGAKAELDRFAEALADYDRALEFDPALVAAYVERALVYGQLKRHDEALADYDRALELDPLHAPAYARRGMARTARGDREGGQADCERAVELAPSSALAHQSRGLSRAAQERYQEALADYDRALELDPGDSMTFALRGVAQGQRGLLEEARADFERAVELDPRNAEAWENLGLASLSLGREEEGFAAYARALELDPENASAYRDRGIVLAELGRSEEALVDLNRSLELDPRDARTYAFRGVGRAMLDRNEEALVDLNRSLEIDPEDAEVYRDRGMVLASLLRFSQALADYERSLALNPGDSLTHTNRGVALANLGRDREAVESFDYALQLGMPESQTATVREQRARALARLGR